MAIATSRSRSPQYKVQPASLPLVLVWGLFLFVLFFWGFLGGLFVGVFLFVFGVLGFWGVFVFLIGVFCWLVWVFFVFVLVFCGFVCLFCFGTCNLMIQINKRSKDLLQAKSCSPSPTQETSQVVLSVCSLGNNS